MLKVDNIEVSNFRGAIRGMRNALNSWAKADSGFDENGNFIIGPNDMTLAMRLRKAGSASHRKYLRQIFVCLDITAPLYWWKEFDTYKVATVANSCSTMHKITSKEFVMDDFSTDHMTQFGKCTLQATIACLEADRNKYIETKDKSYWYEIIQLLPTSYNQMRTVTLNYENLIGMYFDRKDHKLDEWHILCDVIKSLPYAEQLILGEYTSEEK